MSKRFFVSLVFGILFAFPTHVLRAQTQPPDEFQKGMVAYNLGNFEGALNDFKVVLNDNPDSWEAYEQEGYCYFHLNRRSEMSGAFSESLRLHPGNLSLVNFINQLSEEPPPSSAPIPAPTAVPAYNQAPAAIANPGSNPGVIPAPNPAPPPSTESSFPTRVFPKTPTPSFIPAPAAPVEAQPGRDKWSNSCWLNLSGAFSYGALGDLNKAANLWNQQISQYSAQGNASVANLGFQFAAEEGFALGKANALSLQEGFETGHRFQQHLVYSSPLTLSINPQLFTFGLNYYHYIPTGNSRFILTGGVLLGLAVVDYYQDDPIETIQGPLSGNSLGFTLGVGEEWRVSSAVGFQMIGRFRYLSISQLQNSFNVPGLGGGQAVLAADSQGDLGLATPQEIGQNGLRYAVMDYTGFNLNFSFNFYLF